MINILAKNHVNYIFFCCGGNKRVFPGVRNPFKIAQDVFEISLESGENCWPILNRVKTNIEGLTSVGLPNKRLPIHIALGPQLIPQRKLK